MSEGQLDLWGETHQPAPKPIVVASYERRPPSARPQKSGFALRDEALAEIERKRHDWLAKARDVALAFAVAHINVAADDLDIPLPTGAHPNTRGGIFRSPWFKRLGYRPSLEPSRHAGLISVYGLSELGRAEAKRRGLF